MAFQTIYRLQAKNKEGQTLIIHISDTTSGVGTPTYHDLTLATCVLEVSNSSEDKFSRIASKTVSLSFTPTQTYALGTFLSGDDNKFKVEIFLSNTSVLFYTGFLLTNATKERLLPKSVDGEWALFMVELTATDNIPTLKEKPLTDDSGDNPRGLYSPVQYLSWILKKTGLELPINIIDNVVSSNDPETFGNWWNTVLIWSKTFEFDINISEDCYTALEKLLTGCIIFQEFGEWWVLSRDEMLGGAYNIWRYDTDGVFDVVDTNTYTKTIGESLTITPIDKNAQAMPVRAHKFDAVTYDYTLPIEIIDNQDFSRDGTTPIFTGPYVDPDDGITKTESQYALEDWLIGRYAINSEVPTLSSPISAFIRRLFYPTGYEVNRYLAIPFTSSSLPNVYVRSNPVPVSKRDRVTVGVDFRFTSTSVSDYQNIWYALLKGDDGNYYWYNPATPGVWQNTSIYTGPAVNATFAYLYHYADNNDKLRWMNLSYDMKEVPVDGEIYIFLMACYASGQEVHYQNLTIDYLPYINGSYAKYSGDVHKESQAGEIKDNRDEVISITDSPKKLFKGALRHQSGGGTPLISSFWRYPTPGISVTNRFGFWRSQAFYFQYFQPTVIITTNLFGYGSDTNPSNIPGMLHQYEFDFSTNDDFTADRWFCMLSYKQDLISCQWEATLADVINNSIGHSPDGDHEFKYKSL